MVSPQRSRASASLLERLRAGELPEALASHEGFRRLAEILDEFESLVVAYSGGVDSAFLLYAASVLLGERVVGVLAFSESLDRHEFDAARALAEQFSLPVEVIETKEYDNPDYRRNDRNRCYHCKSELFQVATRFAAERGIRHVADGSNADDTADFRPGLRARDEQHVRSPLLEAGLDKLTIRELSRQLGLPTWDKPAAPCLSSRIPYGTPVTSEKLRQIEAAEKGLRDLGFREVRVRHHGEIARLEVASSEISRLVENPTRERVLEAVRAAGFLFVAVDLEGFRSGSLNRSLGVGGDSLVPLSEIRRLSRRDSGTGASSSLGEEDSLREDRRS